MSAVIKTATPFVIESVLFKALTAVGAEPLKVTGEILEGISGRNKIQLGDILTNRNDYYGRQFFREQGDLWLLSHDSSEMGGRIVGQLAQRQYSPVRQFLSELNFAYSAAYQQHLEMLAEQERIRLEEERKARVEKMRLDAIAKAKSQGYAVKESRTAQGQIQLVLTRTV